MKIIRIERRNRMRIIRIDRRVSVRRVRRKERRVVITRKNNAENS